MENTRMMSHLKHPWNSSMNACSATSTTGPSLSKSWLSSTEACRTSRSTGRSTRKWRRNRRWWDPTKPNQRIHRNTIPSSTQRSPAATATTLKCTWLSPTRLIFCPKVWKISQTMWGNSQRLKFWRMQDTSTNLWPKFSLSSKMHPFAAKHDFSQIWFSCFSKTWSKSTKFTTSTLRRSWSALLTCSPTNAKKHLKCTRHSLS